MDKKKKIYIIFILAISLFLLNIYASYVQAQNLLPEQFTAYYQSRKGLISGQSTVSLTAEENGSYHYKSVTTVTGFASIFTNNKIIEQSHWKYVNEKIRPIKYSYNRSGSKKRNVELTFDWKNKSVTNSINSDPWKMSIEDDTLDKLIYQLALMQDLGNMYKQDQQQKTLTYSVADGGKLKKYTIIIHGKEEITTKLGVLQTIKVSRTKGKRTTTMWCAEKFNYLPVWIKQEKKGGSGYTAKIYKLEGFPGNETIIPAENADNEN